MENVPGMLWKRHEAYLNDFYEEGHNAGYDVRKPIIIDARDYGVPQRRKRVFVLGVRKGVNLDIEWPPYPTHCNPKQLNTDTGLKPWSTAREVFDASISIDDPNGIHMNHSQRMIERLKEVPLNGGSRRDTSWILPCHEEHNGHTDVYGRIDPSQPGPTMTTACVNPSKGRFVHPTENHGITVRHAARFQTFPDDFVFHGGLMAAGAQVGNAVPVRLGEALLAEIKKGLLKRAR
jgi:DNA (cytosine-5)-methyltransferase 1